MTILSKHLKAESSSPQTTRELLKRSKLYVLASEPAITGVAQSTEWALELVVPRSTQVGSTSGAASRSFLPHSQSRYRFFSHDSHKQQQEAHTSDAGGIPATARAESELHYDRFYFSRLRAEPVSTECPESTVLKIFLCSIPRETPNTPASTSPLASSRLLTAHIADALAAVHMTADSASWLRQALSTLQGADIIPLASHGLDANKFMVFATSYLDQHVREVNELRNGDISPTEVNYSKIVRENERLRRMLTSDATDYAVVDTAVKAEQRNLAVGDVDEDEDMWNLTPRPKTQRNNSKSWGGFWVTHGSNASSHANPCERQRQEPWQRSDPYGGLM